MLAINTLTENLHRRVLCPWLGKEKTWSRPCKLFFVVPVVNQGHRWRDERACVSGDAKVGTVALQVGDGTMILPFPSFDLANEQFGRRGRADNSDGPHTRQTGYLNYVRDNTELQGKSKRT